MSHPHAETRVDKNAQLKYGVLPKTLRAYFIGLFLSLLFTFASFAIVTDHRLSVGVLYLLLAVFAIGQLFAQIIYFLRFTMSEEGRWNTMPFIFTGVIIVVLIFGSLWIMYNLDYNMMH